MNNLLQECPSMLGPIEKWGKLASRYKVQKALIGHNLTREDKELRRKIVKIAIAECENEQHALIRSQINEK
jgi:hypothetical protein